MDDFTRASDAWKKDLAPIGHENDVVLDFVYEELTVCGHVGWHSGLCAYHFEPFIALEDGKYQEIELRLESGVYEELVEDLYVLGVKHMTRIYRRGQRATEVQESFNGLFKPNTITPNNRVGNRQK